MQFIKMGLGQAIRQDLTIAESEDQHSPNGQIVNGGPSPVQIPGPTITVHAVNLDNNADRLQLIDLIDSNYGDGFTNRVPNLLELPRDIDEADADDPIFNLIHVVAEQEGRFVAHLAVKRHELFHHSRFVYELILPAILPAFRREAFRLARLLWGNIIEQARRQKVAAIYHYSPLKHPLLQLMAVKCFGSVESAIVPAAPARFGGIRLPTGRFNERNRAKSLLMCNILDNNAFATSEPIRVPGELAEAIRQLYDEIGLERTVVSEDLDSSPKVSVVYRNPGSLLSGVTDISLIPIASHQGGGLSINDALKQLAEIELAVAAKASIAIPLSRDGAACLVSELLDRGYTFSGIRPLPSGRDEILLSSLRETDLTDSIVYSRQAQSLKQVVLRFASYNSRGAH